jgi:hypothetical protein
VEDGEGHEGRILAFRAGGRTGPATAPAKLLLRGPPWISFWLRAKILLADQAWHGIGLADRPPVLLAPQREESAKCTKP